MKNCQILISKVWNRICILIQLKSKKRNSNGMIVTQTVPKNTPQIKDTTDSCFSICHFYGSYIKLIKKFLIYEDLAVMYLYLLCSTSVLKQSLQSCLNIVGCINGSILTSLNTKLLLFHSILVDNLEWTIGFENQNKKLYRTISYMFLVLFLHTH